MSNDNYNFERLKYQIELKAKLDNQLRQLNNKYAGSRERQVVEIKETVRRLKTAQ